MLYIVRHGQTDWNLEHRIQGQSDIPLNSTGRAQATQVATELSRFNLKYIISSDLSRAAETAQIIGDALRINVEYDPRLREYDFGNLTGRVRQELDAQTIKSFFAAPVKFDAEPFEHAFARVGEFLRSVDYGKNILVVTHGGVINFVLCYLEDRNIFNPHSYLDKCLNNHIENSAILRIKGSESGISILKDKRFYALPRSH